MIKAILVFNIRGQARMMKFFDSCTIELQQKLLRDAYQMISKRDESSCNFIELNESKLVYRHYATLYFVIVIDASESEYDIYEVIHNFVQCLDEFFGNVCELDLVFHSDKVNQIVSEIFMGGFIVSRSSTEILNDMRMQRVLETREGGVLAHVGTKIKSAVDMKTDKMKMDAEKKFDVKL